MNPVDDFRHAIEAAGLTAPDVVIIDGKIHRFASNGDASDDSGWYVLFPDGLPAGAFGDWRLDLKQNWCEKPDRQLTTTERADYRARCEQARRQRDAEERQRHAEAAQRAQSMWDAAQAANATHRYLTDKGVGTHGLRVGTDGRLIVPVLIDDAIASLQFIHPDPTVPKPKEFLAGGAIKGGYFVFGQPQADRPLLLCEGFATGASLHESTGYAVVMAFSASNLPCIAEQARQEFPSAVIVLCGDNDVHAGGKENTGVVKATAAATAIGGVLAIPELDGKKCDWNDVHVHCGLAAVKEAIEAAIRSATATASDGAEANSEPLPQQENQENTDMTMTMTMTEAQPVDTKSDPNGEPQPDSWPTLDEAALRGVIGDLVRAIEPHTESDRAALLVQCLVAYGNTLNRSAFFRAEADKHYMNIFAGIVGVTAKGRKGISWGHIRRMFEVVDPDWASTRVLNGLSSGEGLIWAVRDEITKEEPLREKNRPTGEYQTVVVDRGILDKRLLVLESEFAGTLKVMSRDGNTLSVLIRQAWDSGNLRSMTKNSPAQATGAHISILGHVTKDELCRLIDATDASNGFLNRFLWVCTRRSKALPEGGQLQDAALLPFVQRLRQAVQFGRSAGELQRDQGAREQWAKVYAELSEGKPGLLGAVISRGEAQVMRLACLYALQDLSKAVTTDHLESALALWEYCETSARYIFGQRLGDPIADELLMALRKHITGMTRTDIRDHFGRNRKAHEIDRGLLLLANHSLARKEEQESGGRPIERWFAVSMVTT